MNAGVAVITHAGGSGTVTARTDPARLALVGQVLIVAACGAADRAPDAARAEPVVRDSAGITIVENMAPVWQPEQAWRLSSEPTLETLGAGDDPEAVLLDPGSAFRADDGRYIVADGMFAGADAVLVFDSAGRFTEQWGREGEGPCEFGQLWWAAPYRGDSIAAHDYYGHTMAIFTPDGRCGREVRLPTWSPPIERGTYGFAHGAEAVYPDGTFLSYPMGYLDVSTGPGPVWYRHALLRVSPDGEVLDSLGLFGIARAWWTGREQKMYPYAALGHLALHGEALYYGTGESYEVRRYDGAGALRAIIRRAHDPAPVTQEDREAYRRWYLDQVASSPYHGGEAAVERAERELADVEYPDRKPAFSDILTDSEGNLWVEEYRWITPDDMPPDPGPTTWSVFDPDGRWLGDVRVPARVLLRSIGDDYVIAFWKDPFGVTRIQVYALRKPEGDPATD